MKKVLFVTIFLVTGALFAESYSPEKYYMLKPIDEDFPLSFKDLRSKAIVNGLIKNAINFFMNRHYLIRSKEDKINAANLIIYSYILYEQLPKGEERKSIADAASFFARKMYLQEKSPFYLYAYYVFKDLANVSYKEIYAAPTFVESAVKYKKMIDLGGGCALEGGPYRTLGRMYYKVSLVIPVYMSRAENYYLKAVECSVNFSMNYLLLEDLYLANGNIAEAEEMIDKIKYLRPQNYLELYFKIEDYATAVYIFELYKNGKWNPWKHDLIYDRYSWPLKFHHEWWK